jgi:PPM family protein phosphatase
VRRENQDRFEIVALAGERGLLLVVADGMGGPAGGGAASRIAVERFVAAVRDGVTPETGSEELAGALRSGALAAHRVVREAAAGAPGLRGMGTTLTAAAIWGGSLHLLQVGDSRAYLFRDGALVQLTRDQSVVQKMLDAGVLTEAQARQSPHRNVILQALGADDVLDPVVGEAGVQPGDRILVCSDGLSGALEGAELERILGEDADPEAQCDALERATLAAGAPDNVTCIVARVGDDGGVSPPPPGPEPLRRP